MNKKNIAIISKYFTPANAGIEVNILETYSKLAKRWNLTMHTSKDTLKERDILENHDIVNGIKVNRYYFGRNGFMPQIDWAKTDLICFHNFNVFFFRIFLVAWWHRLKGDHFRIIVTPHGGFNPEWRVFPRLTAVAKYLYHRTLGTFFLNNLVDRIRAVSEWEKKSIIEMGVKESKIVVITNGLEDDAFKNIDQLASVSIKKQVKSFGKYLIQVGRIYPIKNYETTIRALPLIPASVKYVIVGEEEKNNNYQDYKQSLIDLAASLGVSDRLIFTGQVRGIDKYYLLKHAALMVHMAMWESFCNVVHEGMSQGLVCIVANNTALPLLVKDHINGYCVETNDSRELANKINYVLSNAASAKIKKIRATNKSIGRDDSWANVASKMNNLYTKEIYAKS